MEIQKTAQQQLFKKLEKAEITYHNDTQYNGFGISDLGHFQQELDELFEAFKKELSDNLTNLPPALKVYLIDIHRTIAELYKAHLEKQRTEIYDVHKNDYEFFRDNSLGYFRHFFDYQKGVIYNTYQAIEQKLAIVNDPELYPVSGSSVDSGSNPALTTGDSEKQPQFTLKLKSNLGRKDLTVLWWLLSECDFIEFDSQKHLAAFLQENFLFADPDTDGTQYREMVSIQSLLSKLKKDEDVKPGPSQKMIAAKLRDQLEQLKSNIEVIELLDLPQNGS